MTDIPEHIVYLSIAFVIAIAIYLFIQLQLAVLWVEERWVEWEKKIDKWLKSK